MKPMKWIRNLSANLKLTARIRLILLSTIVLFLISSAGICYQFFNIREHVKEIQKQEELNYYVTNLISIINNKDLLIMDYVFSKKLANQEQIEGFSKEFQETVNKIKPMLTEEKQKNILNLALENYDKYEQSFKKDIVPLMESGKDDTAKLVLQIQISNYRYQIISSLNELTRLTRSGSQSAYDYTYSAFQRGLTILGGSVVLSTVIGFLLLWALNRYLNRNMNKVMFTASEIADGNLRISDLDRVGKDELGQLGVAMNRMKKSLSDIIAQISDVSDRLVKQSNDLVKSTNDLHSGSQQIAATMEELSSGSEEQANAANHLYEKMQQFLGTIAEVVYKSEDTKKVSEKMLAMTNEGRQNMDDSILKMAEINEKINQSLEMLRGLDSKIKNINKLVIVIKDIADQTNLLALNASIEAARAGEHGKGFVVVAAEVRKLAEQVTSSVTDINSILSDIQKESGKVLSSLEEGYGLVSQGSDQMMTTGRTIVQLIETINDVGKQIENMADALYNLIDNSQTIGTSIENIASVSQESAAGIEQTSATVQQASMTMDKISASAEALDEEARRLKQLVEKFQI
ncbi:methyl-accepting chemotaxis protein [Caldibacillus debilis]|uniref:methyl-accepting chemotaxis protein n=1 Tax=Caldibacillus debilis TaxID=301148 RepID=UPI00037CDF4B|nr:methyl-accepting chemotaxis protein [Caldibacillus debilis]